VTLTEDPVPGSFYTWDAKSNLHVDVKFSTKPTGLITISTPLYFTCHGPFQIVGDSYELALQAMLLNVTLPFTISGSVHNGRVGPVGMVDNKLSNKHDIVVLSDEGWKSNFFSSPIPVGGGK